MTYLWPQQLLYVLRSIKLTEEKHDLCKAIHALKCTHGTRQEAFIAINAKYWSQAAKAKMAGLPKPPYPDWSGFSLEESQLWLDEAIRHVENYKPPEKRDALPFWTDY